MLKCYLTRRVPACGILQRILREGRWNCELTSWTRQLSYDWLVRNVKRRAGNDPSQ
jgi:hypothetical protein